MTTDVVTELVRYEMGELDEEETVELFQRLVTSGLIFHLQGSYQRIAYQLLRCGRLVDPNNHYDSG